MDPKLGYALLNLYLFPVDVNNAGYEMILRIRGVGVQSAQHIIQVLRHRKLTFYHLKKIGVVLKRAKYFIITNELPAGLKVDLPHENLKWMLLSDSALKRKKAMDTQ
ncbi:MAG: hypothetical protein K0B11_09035 [Mariniphaga sp.]|nr:hypothetical protein [Mariniphaga sp.]